MSRIISFSGRMHSGKTTLCQICVDKYGYTLINFADKLKQVICDIFDITMDYLNDNKEVYKEYLLTARVILLLNQQLCIPKQLISDTLPKSFYSLREALQLIGTRLIRQYNSDWHINSIQLDPIYDGFVDPTKKYCFGDTRFPNEKAFIERLGGACWYITRPLYPLTSNHESETSLSAEQFGDRVIVNDGTKDELINKFTHIHNPGHYSIL